MNIVDVSEIEVPNIKTRDILATKKPYVSSRKKQLIIGASATLSCGSQYALGYQILDVTIGRVLRTMIYLIPFGGIQLAFKTIKKHVECLQKPQNPRRHVKTTLLSMLQILIIIFTMIQNLRRKTIVTLILYLSSL